MAIAPSEGGVLQMEISSTFTTIAQIQTITPPARSRNLIDQTGLTDTVEKRRVGVILRSASATLRVWLDTAAATHAAVEAALQDGLTRNFKIILNDAGDTEYAFAGFIESITISELAVDTDVSADITIAVNGAITLTP